MQNEMRNGLRQAGYVFFVKQEPKSYTRLPKYSPYTRVVGQRSSKHWSRLLRPVNYCSVFVCSSVFCCCQK